MLTVGAGDPAGWEEEEDESRGVERREGPAGMRPFLNLEEDLWDRWESRVSDEYREGIEEGCLHREVRKRMSS